MAKHKFEVELEDIHIKLLKSLIPFYGNDLNEVLRLVIIRFIDDFIFENKFSRLKEELKHIMDNKNCNGC